MFDVCRDGRKMRSRLGDLKVSVEEEAIDTLALKRHNALVLSTAKAHSLRQNLHARLATEVVVCLLLIYNGHMTRLCSVCQDT